MLLRAGVTVRQNKLFVKRIPLSFCLPKVKVPPAFQVPAPESVVVSASGTAIIGHPVQLLPLLFQNVRRRTHIEMRAPAPLRVSTVAERESRKVQTRSLFLQLPPPAFPPD